MMSAKMANLDLLKIKGFLNKVCHLIISANDFTNKILLRDLNYIVDVVIWPKFGNSSFSMKEAMITLILQGSDKKKTLLLRGGLDSSSIIWG